MLMRQSGPNAFSLSIEAWPARQQVTPSACGGTDAGVNVKGPDGRTHTSGLGLYTESDEESITSRCLADPPAFERNLCLQVDRRSGFIQHEEKQKKRSAEIPRF
ncbi:hypothetical protein CupriaWKF_17860 [Cupriavidus sp. WKF15]|uniref:hypothetical protein n=1 Tax=Cupriavidus sp. WKF15 TaxID=3032282 RepID=UPI0023E1A3D1|nr:hypothetical protein [Cupriavidus sp. WKF15]WER49042.1 hypothetical protein CupriaWKF_17860 [Cupriavidus sp. WKF15]